MGVTKGAISQTIRKLVHKNLILRTNINNRKEVNLRLSEKGRIVLKCTGFLSEGDFHFCRDLYENARPEDREIVRRLFMAIAGNMEDRVKAL